MPISIRLAGTFAVLAALLALLITLPLAIVYGKAYGSSQVVPTLTK